jgi:hypothetical protein
MQVAAEMARVLPAKAAAAEVVAVAARTAVPTAEP